MSHTVESKSLLLGETHTEEQRDTHINTHTQKQRDTHINTHTHTETERYTY
jgi:hypothetical protein